MERWKEASVKGGIVMVEVLVAIFMLPFGRETAELYLMVRFTLCGVMETTWQAVGDLATSYAQDFLHRCFELAFCNQYTEVETPPGKYDRPDLNVLAITHAKVMREEASQLQHSTTIVDAHYRHCFLREGVFRNRKDAWDEPRSLRASANQLSELAAPATRAAGTGWWRAAR